VDSPLLNELEEGAKRIVGGAYDNAGEVWRALGECISDLEIE